MLKNLSADAGISTANWALIKEKVGKDGPLKNFELRPDGLRFFNDEGPLGADLFRKQIEEALEHGEDYWKGPAWNVFVEAMSNPSSRRNTAIITARYHSPKAIMAGLLLLKERGLIAAVPDEENINSVGWKGLPDRFKAPTLADSKAKVMVAQLDEIETVSMPIDAHLVTNREGTGLAQLHLWGFSDDDFGNFSKALEVLAPLVGSGRWPHIKLVLFYTGLNNPDQRPHAVVIKPDGSFRPATAHEATRNLVLTNLKTPEEARIALDQLIDDCTSFLKR